MRNMVSAQTVAECSISAPNSMAYVFTVRRLATSSLSCLLPNDPDREEAQRTISKLVPFLFDKKSTTVFQTLSEVIMDLRSRVDKVPF